MNTPLRVAIQGATGRMGQQLTALVEADARFTLAARLDSSSRLEDVPAFDVAVDFSAPAGLHKLLAHCRQQRVALVSGTTGLDDATRQAWQAAGTDIALLHGANFSLGVAMLKRLLAEAAGALADWQLEIVEAHHSGKRDAPSGTALALGEAAAAARGRRLDEVQHAGRSGLSEPREAQEIGFASLRAADIVGEHTALLAHAGERIELSHRATDRGIFARGALDAAAWLAGKQPGHYTLDDMLAESSGPAAD